jgi:glycosyltransferase involved in cell wall biosynthesis
MSGGVLYISYSGMLEPLGQSQVLAYQERLASSHPVHLISFERTEDWTDAEAREAVTRRMQAAGVHWHPLRYHKRPSALATAWDILAGTFTGLRLVRRHGLAIVHARSYVSSVMALTIKRLTGAKYVFDMRGFWADERVDGGLWPRDGRMYRIAKWFERRFLLGADHVVSLTHAAVQEMQRFPYLAGQMPPVTVIPTCADLERFQPMEGQRGADFMLGYVGSAGTWYLFDAVAACFRHLLETRPDARLLVINRNEHEYIRECLASAGVPADAVEIRAASHGEVPDLMARMHAGVFFIKPVFSKQASAPTKLGEFLGCGVPCLSNHGVGDMAKLLEGDRVGVAVQDFSPNSLAEGMDRLLDLVADADTPTRCVAAAHRHFSLDKGVRSYDQIYRELGIVSS